MYDYIFWDLDGTITKSAPGVISSVKHALDKLGITDYPAEILNRFIGPSLYDSFTTNFGMSDELAETAIEIYREKYETGELFNATVYDGIPEALTELKEAGLRLALVTSKPTPLAIRVADHFDISRYMDAIIAPTPDDHSSDKSVLIRRALEHYGNPDKQYAVMVGDKCYDIKGAKDAGVDGIGVLYGYGSREELSEAGATAIVETPKQIAEYILSRK